MPYLPKTTPKNSSCFTTLLITQTPASRPYVLTLHTAYSNSLLVYFCISVYMFVRMHICQPSETDSGHCYVFRRRATVCDLHWLCVLPVTTRWQIVLSTWNTKYIFPRRTVMLGSCTILLSLTRKINSVCKGSVGVRRPACVMLFCDLVIQMPFCSNALHLLSPQLTCPESNTCKRTRRQI